MEVAALVFAVKHFKVYLLSQEFTVYTDHQALISAFMVHLKSQTQGRLAQWYLRITKFILQMKLEYKPGSANDVADALSMASDANAGVNQRNKNTTRSGCQVKRPVRLLHWNENQNTT